MPEPSGPVSEPPGEPAPGGRSARGRRPPARRALEDTGAATESQPAPPTNTIAEQLETLAGEVDPGTVSQSPAAQRRRRGGRQSKAAIEPEAALAETVTAERTEPEREPAPRGRGRRTPGAAVVAELPEQEAPAPIDALELEFAVAPASDDELRAIARATGSTPAILPATVAETGARALGFDEDEDLVTWTPSFEAEGTEALAIEAGEQSETADEAGAGRRRRRRGRGRRGRGGAAAGAQEAAAELPDDAQAAAADVAESLRTLPVQPSGRREPQQAEPRQPQLPAYPVEFEPMPPPTKRRPARRPGMTSEPRFSREEQAEIDQFVRTEPVAPAPRTPAADELRASLLTAEEERELAAAKPHRRSRRGRGSGGTAAQPAEAELQVTPAFAPMPAEPVARAGQNPLETLIARQNVIFDTLMERQIALLRNIERSLLALDQRLGRGGQGLTSVPRVGVFVDVPNVIFAAERIGCTIDFGKLLALLTRGRELVRASAYSPVSDDPQMRVESQKFVQPFMGRGFRIVTKPLKRFADGTMKGNFDVELAMDVLTMADRLDIVCLISGDGDFSRLVEMVAVKGVRVEVVAFSSSTSSELRAACDEYIDLATRLREICS